MAITCETPTNFGEVLTTAHVVITSMLELQKGTLAVNVGIWRSRAEYLSLRPLVANPRYLIAVADLDLSANLRTGIYSYLMQQPEFGNPVADMNDDFPVTPI